MNKYIIEDGINFYEELYKSLDITENNDKNDADSNLCLITKEQLTDKFIKLECGHQFNYLPLFLDIKNHKQHFNGMESTHGRLNVDEIRCPYCRKKQKGLLPYYEELGIDKTHGVNYINIFAKKSTVSHGNYKKCEYKQLNPSYDPSGNEAVETQNYNIGNCKFHVCWNYGFPLHYYSSTNYGDEKSYCYFHKTEIIKKYKQEIKQKLKLEAKNAKILAKEEAKKMKEEEKQKEKEDKKLKMLESKKQKIISENVVLGPSIVVDSSGNQVNNTCMQILKSGLNKGSYCGCKIVLENMCKRHFLSNNKNN